VEQVYPLHRYQTVIIARDKCEKERAIAMRLRVGRCGYSQWLNELQVYLLPNFSHPNIVHFLGCDKRVRRRPAKANKAQRRRERQEQEEKEARGAARENHYEESDSGEEIETDFIHIEAEDEDEPFFDTDELLKEGPLEEETEPEEEAAIVDVATQMKMDDRMALSDLETSNHVDLKAKIAEAAKLRPFKATKSTVEWKPRSDQETKPELESDEDDESQRQSQSESQIPIEYWILNDFGGCITLRHYLMMHVLSWAQMLKIARGILKGLLYLHENIEYQDWNHVKIVDRFIRSTNGALKKISFREKTGVVHMKPHLYCAIIHRNLSSLNIVLKADLTPCIWNFGQSYVCHPFQPINHDHLVDARIRSIHSTSPYSPPEVLLGKGYLTMSSMKAVDIYACGILFWEMMSRCCLPKLDKLSEIERRDRLDPDPYSEPFSKEFRGKITSSMLKHAVCRHKARPRSKLGWLIGRKTNRFVQTYREMWDQDYDARLHVATVIDRLDQMSSRDSDKRCRFPPTYDRYFDVNTMWPPGSDLTRAPILPARNDTNICFEKLEDDSSESSLISFPED